MRRSFRTYSLFFRRVSDGGGGTFRHLVGNVAEIVSDAPGQFDAWEPKRTPEGVAGFASQLAHKLFVSGGAAVSAAQVGALAPHPPAPPDPRARAAGLIDRVPSFGHIVVDEAQDLSPMQCRAIARRSVHGSLTVLGDLAQGTAP
jgi:hypothetical protein